MSEFERRALLGAVGVGALAAMSKGGPLDPPAGAVAPSGRTLDEIYQKIPSLPNGTADGRIQIPASGSLVTISTPGNYVLTGDVSAGAVAINIISSNVDLDLNGFRVTSAALSGFGAVTLGLVSQVAVRNGWIVGGAFGVYANFNTSGVLLDNLRIVGAKQYGVNVPPSASRAWQIRRCHVMDTGDIATLTSAVRVAAMGVVIEDTAIYGLHSTAGSPVFRGIELGNTASVTGNHVARCTVGTDSMLPAGSIGVYAAGGLAVRDTTVLNFATGYQVLGVFANGGGNV